MRQRRSLEFNVSDLKDVAGDQAFKTAGLDVADIDGPYEDEWSLYASITLNSGQSLQTILHHGTGFPLHGECDCTENRIDVFCSHLVWVGLIHLGLDEQYAEQRDLGTTL